MKILRDNRGAAAIEYALLVALISVAMISSLHSIDLALEKVFNRVTTVLSTNSINTDGNNSNTTNSNNTDNGGSSTTTTDSANNGKNKKPKKNKAAACHGKSKKCG